MRATAFDDVEGGRGPRGEDEGKEEEHGHAAVVFGG